MVAQIPDTPIPIDKKIDAEFRSWIKGFVVGILTGVLGALYIAAMAHMLWFMD